MDELIRREMAGCVRYFEDARSKYENTKGLILDRLPSNPRMSSIAATGFGMAGLAVAADRGLLPTDYARDTALETLKTVLTLPHEGGFLYHFYDITTGGRYSRSELSSIDTTLFLCGAVAAGEYFGNEVKAAADALTERVVWETFLCEDAPCFYMGKLDGELYSRWDSYAEQLAMYVLASAKGKHADCYAYFERPRGAYKGESYIYTDSGSLFTHLYSHAFIDFSRLSSPDGVDWHKNAALAVAASKAYCRDRGYPENVWGLSACDGPCGYVGNYGNPPSGMGDTRHNDDGTIACYAAVSSIVFDKNAATAALAAYYSNSELICEYGLRDSFNHREKWTASDCIGIDKGITLIMLGNAESGVIWNSFMKNKTVQRGLEVLGFTSGQ